MSYRIPPTREDGFQDNDMFSHPAFGFVRVSRVQGGDPNLFMSNVKHDGKVSIVIGTAKMERSHHHDKHYSRKELIQVEMSTVQFADMMAGMNTGSGVPCTLRRVCEGPYVGVPGIDMENTVSRYSKEVKQRFAETGKELKDLAKTVREALEAAKVSKAKQADILGPIEKLATEIGSNMPFMAEMFRESVEELVQEAKAVVETYAVDKGMDPADIPLLLGKS